ncbi:MAG: uroporphyrinogen decarboxylase [Rhodospirillales bacterium]|nr:MAG: uroporphyrinogen decarboxylase [Rhodospirillales bacterium]
MSGVRDAFAGVSQPRPPFWLMRQAGRYLPEYRALRAEAPDFLTFCYTPSLTTEAALQPIRRFGMDAAIVFSDILVVPHALGMEVRFLEGVGPRLTPVGTPHDVIGLESARLEERLEPVYTGIAGLRRALASERSLIGFAGAPWTLACYMVEGQGGSEARTARRWAYADPEGFGGLMALLEDAVVRHLGAQIKAGADVVQLFDSWAGLLSEQQLRRWVIEPTARIVRRLKEAWPEVPIIGFPRGGGLLYHAYAIETGVDGVSLDAGVPARWAAETLQAVVLVQGCLDNQLLVVGGTAMDREIDRLLSTLGQGRYVFNLGHGVLPETPPEHVARLAERVRTWSGSAGVG